MRYKYTMRFPALWPCIPVIFATLLGSCAPQTDPTLQPVAPVVQVEDVLRPTVVPVREVVREVSVSKDGLAEENSKLEGKLEEVRRENQSLSEELRIAEELGSADKDQLAHFRTRSELLEKLNSEAEALVEKQREIIDTLGTQIEDLRSQVAGLQADIAEATKSAESNANALTEANDRISKLTASANDNASAAFTYMEEVKTLKSDLLAARLKMWAAVAVLVLLIVGSIAWTLAKGYWKFTNPFSR